MRKICFVIGSRANYGSVKALMKAIQADSELNLQIILTSSALSQKYGDISNVLELDGFEIDIKLPTLLEATTPAAMVKTTALTLIEISTALDYLNPDIIFTIGDRYETIATAIAVAYTNRILAHTMGGELSGTIDESVRHAITKLAHLHFVSTENAKKIVLSMGENPELIYLTGCPRIDLVKETLKMPQTEKNEILNNILRHRGVGKNLDYKKPFIVLALHPVTSEWQESQEQLKVCLEAINLLEIQTIIIWPNADAGSNAMAQSLRFYREKFSPSNLRFLNDLSPEEYFILLDACAVLIGNSSSGVREGSYIGTPFVNIGTRQTNREHSTNLINCEFDVEKIRSAVEKQLQHGKFESSKLYGTGEASNKIISVIKGNLPQAQKNFYSESKINYEK